LNEAKVDMVKYAEMLTISLHFSVDYLFICIYSSNAPDAMDLLEDKEPKWQTEPAANGHFFFQHSVLISL